MLNIGALSNIHFQQPITVSHAFYAHSHYAISYRSVFEQFEGKTAHHAVISVSDRVSLNINLQFVPINFRGGIMTSNAVRRFIKIYGALYLCGIILIEIEQHILGLQIILNSAAPLPP